MPYKQYWKSEFQNTLTSIANTGKINRWTEISSNLENNQIPINEYVYQFTLRNKSVSIIIYSSIDKKTDRTREVGSDAVRIIFEWKTKEGKKYNKIAKHYRTESLFSNMIESINKASEKCFKLNDLEWVERGLALEF
ncbi:hypothetical protein [Marinicellulosiphila megalodicopiae]|uniref:hypothetical protein n=1 Tax=Marinicellulosiphila megalodicopiae TaxID=2724896 RepID=UPI003BB17445